MIAVGMYKQKKFDIRKQWIQDNIDQLAALFNQLFNSNMLPSKYDNAFVKKKIWKEVEDFTNRIAYIDFSDDYRFGIIENDIKKIKEYFIQSYNNLAND